MISEKIKVKCRSSIIDENHNNLFKKGDFYNGVLSHNLNGQFEDTIVLIDLMGNPKTFHKSEFRANFKIVPFN